MAQHDALGAARGAGSEEYGCRLVRAGLRVRLAASGGPERVDEHRRGARAGKPRNLHDIDAVLRGIHAHPGPLRMCGIST